MWFVNEKKALDSVETEANIEALVTQDALPYSLSLLGRRRERIHDYDFAILRYNQIAVNVLRGVRQLLSATVGRIKRGPEWEAMGTGTEGQ